MMNEQTFCVSANGWFFSATLRFLLFFCLICCFLYSFSPPMFFRAAVASPLLISLPLQFVYISPPVRPAVARLIACLSSPNPPSNMKFKWPGGSGAARAKRSAASIDILFPF
jgi:hypothetical protein